MLIPSSALSCVILGLHIDDVQDVVIHDSIPWMMVKRYHIVDELDYFAYMHNKQMYYTFVHSMIYVRLTR